MLKTLKDLIDRLQVPPGVGSAARSGSGNSAGADPHTVQVATAVLLVEVMCADASLGADERQSVMGTLKQQFALSDDEVRLLVDSAQSQAKAAHDLHSFTSALNERFDEARKIAVVESMWQVAFADGHLAAHEQHILWRVADLLHVPHGAYINAKMRARAAAGLE
jgi:uncharacterized tellurite resistance protein B-like protein